MLKKAVITLALLALPTVALADQASQLSPAASIDSGSSTATGNILQPAGTQTLQASGDAASGIQQPSTSGGLQNAGTAQDAQTFDPTITGAQPTSATASSSDLPLLWGVLLLSLVLLAVSVAYMRAATRRSA